MQPGESECDLLVIGGGINGAGIARDAAGRGLRVVLVERDDLAGHTSSASTKLIHGGLRYLEYREFRLVREALQERERLLAIAPHITRPLRFVVPQPPGGRPAWLIRLGLLLYDRLGGRQSLPRSQAVNLADPAWGEGLKPDLVQHLARGFAYSDAWVDDARLVVLNAMDAAERGARVLTGTAFVGARIAGDRWEADLAPNPAAARPGLAQLATLRARVIVNAAGPWADDVIAALPQVRRQGRLALVKGSHLIVPRIYPGPHAFLLQQADGRIVFTIPYQGRFTLIGTTDVVVGGEERQHPRISQAEIDYLCAAVQPFFARPVSAAEIVATYSGIRPLHDDGSADAKAITRDYVLQLGRREGPQVLSVLGGKLTTYRRLAEHALAKLAPWLPAAGAAWTGTVPLPGGDLPPGGVDAFLAGVRARWPWLPPAVAERMGRAYGARLPAVLGTAASWSGLGEDFGAGLTEAELGYLARHEWAASAEDVLWRRTKLGLAAPPGLAERIAGWFAAQQAG